VATALLTVGVLLVGMVAYGLLPISALPQVDYPTIQILTFYPGASPDVMASSVTTPLERQFGQLPGLNQMTSTSAFGASLITLQFTLEHPIDVAEQEVQAAINAAGTYLPRDLPYSNRYVGIFDFHDGQITRWREYVNPLVVLETLGDGQEWREDRGAGRKQDDKR